MNLQFSCHSSQQQALNQLLATGFFKDFVNYLYVHQNEEVILRTLKQEFAHVPDLEAQIDACVKQQYVLRAKRRYRLNFPVFTTAAVQKMQVACQKPIAVVMEQAANWSLAERLTFLGEELWPHWFAEATPTYLFAYQMAAASTPTFYTRKEISDGKLTFVSLTSAKAMDADLPTYFHLMATRQGFPASFKSLETLLGDVDPVYYLSQAARWLRRARSQRPMPKTHNIFLTSLLETNLITVDAAGHLQLNQPLIESVSSLTPKSGMRQTLDACLVQAESDYATLMFERSLLFQQLAEQLLTTNQNSYIKRQ